MVPFCRKCLPGGISREQYEGTITDYLNSLPAEMKADSDVYRNRLSICSRCGELINGMCRVCGCFVEARAAKKPACCPSIEPKW